MTRIRVRRPPACPPPSADNTASAFLTPLLSAVPTGLKFSQFVTQAASNQYVVKNNSAEFEVVNGTALALGAFVNDADPTTYYRYGGSLTTPGVLRMRCLACAVLTCPPCLRSAGQPATRRCSSTSCPTRSPSASRRSPSSPTSWLLRRVRSQYCCIASLPAALTRRRLLHAGGISRGADNRSPNLLLASTVVSMSKPQIMTQSAASTLRGGVVGAAAVAALIAALF